MYLYTKKGNDERRNIILEEWKEKKTITIGVGRKQKKRKHITDNQKEEKILHCNILNSSQ